MADTKISGLPAAGALTGAELVPIVQGGNTDQTTTGDIAALAPTPPVNPTLGTFEIDPTAADHYNGFGFFGFLRSDTFTNYLVDAAIAPTSVIQVWQSAAPATARTTGDPLWDDVQVAAAPGTGNATLYVNCTTGVIAGSRKFHYAVFN